MTRYATTIFGILGGAGFLWAGLAILWWDVGKLRQARATRDWPTVQGIVIHSTVEDRRGERKPHVEYTYGVEGASHTCHQISFDIFDNPGGQGRIETILDRYPVGKQVTVHFDPDNPTTAILEPEVYSPFFMPLVFGVLFLLGGLLVLWQTFRFVTGAQPASRQIDSTKNRIATTVLVSVLLYVVLVVVSFESAIQDTFVKAFGPHPLGIPLLVFVIGLQTILYLPMPWVFWHLMRLGFQASLDGKKLGIIYLLTVVNSHPQLRGSQRVCIGGLVYFAVICGAWIAYAAALGI
jgi:hypothetical protein